MMITEHIQEIQTIIQSIHLLVKKFVVIILMAETIEVNHRSDVTKVENPPYVSEEIRVIQIQGTHTGAIQYMEECVHPVTHHVLAYAI